MTKILIKVTAGLAVALFLTFSAYRYKAKKLKESEAKQKMQKKNTEALADFAKRTEANESEIKEIMEKIRTAENEIQKNEAIADIIGRNNQRVQNSKR